MNFVILDLEWNSSYSKRVHRYVNEIIEFGAIKFNDNFEIIDKFSMLIKPQIGKKLHNHIVNLTHISNDEVFECENNFLHTCKEFSKFSKDCLLLTWGTSDVLTLIDNFEFYTGKKEVCFLDYYCNLQEYCESMLNHTDASSQLGLQTCADMIGIDAKEDELHRAYEDARLSYLCLKKLYDKKKFLDFIYKANKEFYRKITFKNKTIADINNPLIDKSQLFADCEICGEKLEQLNHFKTKNKSFISKFYCKNCKKEFVVRFNAKLKYDGVYIKKKIFENKKDEKEAKG